MQKYKKFIECLVPGSVCNFKCHYCYIAQLNGTEHRDTATFPYSPETIAYALRPERIGGLAYINICGVGETLIPKEIPDIVEKILEYGHYVNIYTNGTMTRAVENLCGIRRELRERLCFSFSLHWLELIRTGKLDIYFSNLKKVRAAGCSIVSNLVLDDAYLPYVEEIKERCKKEIGAYPQVSFPKKANRNGNYSSLTTDEKRLYAAAEGFDSPYFRFTEKYYNYDRKKFCYAGMWSFHLNLSTGDVHKCYGGRKIQNIFKNLESPIQENPVGTHCPCSACGGGLLLPMGLVPEIHAPSYCALKNREGAEWYTPALKKFLSQQLNENNVQLFGFEKKARNNIEFAKELFYRILVRGYRFLMRASGRNKKAEKK